MENLKETSLGAWFLGPKAEHHETWEKLITFIFRDYVHWRRNYFPEDNVVVSRRHIREHEQWVDNLNDELDKILAALKLHNPTYSPRYLAHMISDQTLPSVIGYFAGMLYNSNNVTGESSPVAVPLEIAVGKLVAQMLGYNPETSWTHICSGGTLANIEALWVARTAKFMPFMLQEFCQSESVDFKIKTPNGSHVDLRECDKRTLLALAPRATIFMVRELIEYMFRNQGREVQAVQTLIDAHIHQSRFNITRRGLHRILSELDVEPVIFISPSAHYSIKKAANVLGYGECAVRTIDVDTSFRININKLRSELENLSEKEYVAAVIGIAGTTEEGAIDPLHRIDELRGELEKVHNRSFWFHIDAAWGGYMRSMFNGYNIKTSDCRSLEAVALRYKDTINLASTESGRETVWDDDLGNYMAMLSFPSAESITIDPHKLGYIPYPAGMISFKHGVVTELIKQDAPYIFNGKSVVSLDHTPVINDIGSYILEGSKPGAAAASCYLAHKTIPLELDGHGKIIKATLQSTIKLQNLMREHLANFESYTLQSAERLSMLHIKPSSTLFTYIPLHHSDSNLICYVMRPVVYVDGSNWQIDEAYTLDQTNRLNEMIFMRMSINRDHKLKSNNEYDYFVSKTRFTDAIYSYSSLESTLRGLNISEQEYAKHGLFVLRTTVMNPFYSLAERNNKDYLEEYMTALHTNAVAALYEYKTGL